MEWALPELFELVDCLVCVQELDPHLQLQRYLPTIFIYVARRRVLLLRHRTDWRELPLAM